MHLAIQNFYAELAFSSKSFRKASMQRKSRNTHLTISKNHFWIANNAYMTCLNSKSNWYGNFAAEKCYQTLFRKNLNILFFAHFWCSVACFLRFLIFFFAVFIFFNLYFFVWRRVEQQFLVLYFGLGHNVSSKSSWTRKFKRSRLLTLFYSLNLRNDFYKRTYFFLFMIMFTHFLE